MSTSGVGVELLHRVGQPVGQHEPTLGVGVGDLGGAAAVLGDHVAGAHRGAADGVLGHRQQSGHPHRAVDRGERGHHGGDHGGAGHVALHRDHRRAGLDGEAAAVEGDALADQHHVLRPCARPWPACSPAARTAAGSPHPGPTPTTPPKPRAASCFSSRTVAVSPAASAAFTACSASQVGVLMLEGTLASSRASQLAPAAATACRRCAVRASSDALSASTILPTGRSRGPSWCIEKPNEPSVAPATKAVIASSSPTAATEEATASTFRVCAGDGGTGSAYVGERGVSDTDQQHPGEVRVDGSGLRIGGSSDRELRDLSGRARGAGALQHGQEVDAEVVGELGRAGPECRTVLAPQDRDGDHRTPRTREGAWSLRANSGGETWVGRDTQRP